MISRWYTRDNYTVNRKQRSRKVDKEWGGRILDNFREKNMFWREVNNARKRRFMGHRNEELEKW